MNIKIHPVSVRIIWHEIPLEVSYIPCGGEFPETLYIVHYDEETGQEAPVKDDIGGLITPKGMAEINALVDAKIRQENDDF